MHSGRGREGGGMRGIPLRLPGTIVLVVLFQLV